MEERGEEVRNKHVVADHLSGDGDERLKWRWMREIEIFFFKSASFCFPSFVFERKAVRWREGRAPPAKHA